MRAITLMLLAPLSLMLMSCTTSPENDFCTLAKPIYLEKTDKVSEATKLEVEEHFKVGQKACGWEIAH